MSIYDFKVLDVRKREVDLKKFQGNILLIVNTATKCTYSQQYVSLNKLYEEYNSVGLEILDFPCNQFLFQAPGSSAEIASFCQMNYGLRFEVLAKVKVNGKFTHPLYKYLKKNGPPDYQDKDHKIGLFLSILRRKKSKNIKWNFTKFLIDREGNIAYRFPPNFHPDNIRPFIEEVVNRAVSN